MAHFRESYCNLEEKYYAEKQAYYDRVREHIKGHKRADRWRRILWGIIGLTLTAVLIWMICRPDISREAGQRTTDFLKNQYEEKSTMNYIFDLPASIHNMPFLLRLIPGFLYPVLRFLQSAILHILSPTLGPVLRLLMYAIPATGPLFLWRVWGDIKISDYSFEKYADDPMIKVLCDEREMDIRRSGLEGEEAAQGCLSSLGDDCYVFTNLYIPYEGKDSETDIIVVSPAGVTIVEVKNHKGVIRGDVSDRKLIQDCGLSGEQAEQYAKYVAEAYEERSRMEYDRFPEENCLQTLKEAQRICAGRSKGETLSAHMIDRFLRVPCEQWQMAKTAVSQYFGCGEDAVDRLYSENEEWLLVSAASASALAEQLLALFDADLSWRIFRNAALLGTEAAMTRISAVLDLMGEEFGGKVIRVDAEADGWLFYRYYSDPVGCIAYMKTCGLTAEGILKAVQNDPLVLYLYKEDRRLSYNHDQAYIDKIIQKYK